MDPSVTEPMTRADATGLRTNHGPSWLVPLLFVVLTYFPFFLHLDALPLRIWDESRQAISAYEMLHNGNLIVTHFNGEPDMWSTKPPLLVWLQTALFAGLGPSELALRLPAALAALLTGWFLLRTIDRTLRVPWMGLIACLILCTSDGFVNTHVARSGDYDAPLVLFMTLSAWAIYRWCLEERPRDILLFFLFLALGAFTKGVQAMMFLPGTFIFLLLERKVIRLMRERYLYLGLLLFVMSVGGFYLAREFANPGFLRAVWMNELGGRFGTALEGHRAPWDYYIQLLMHHHFRAWWWLVPCGIVLGLVHREQAFRRWTRLLVCLGFTYMFVISTAETKLGWYNAPLYPVIAALAALAIYTPLSWLMNARWSLEVFRVPVLPFLLLIAAFIGPYSATIGRVHSPREWPAFEAVYAGSYYLRNALRENVPLEVDALCFDTYNAHLLFYVNLLHDRGDPIRIIPKEALRSGHRALILEPAVAEYVEGHYRYDVLRIDGSLRIYHITGEHHGTP